MNIAMNIAIDVIIWLFLLFVATKIEDEIERHTAYFALFIGGLIMIMLEHILYTQI